MKIVSSIKGYNKYKRDETKRRETYQVDSRWFSNFNIAARFNKNYLNMT